MHRGDPLRHGTAAYRVADWLKTIQIANPQRGVRRLTLPGLNSELQLHASRRSLRHGPAAYRVADWLKTIQIANPHRGVRRLTLPGLVSEPQLHASRRPTQAWNRGLPRCGLVENNPNRQSATRCMPSDTPWAQL